MFISRSKPAVWIARHLLAASLMTVGALLALGYAFIFRGQLIELRQADRVARLGQERQAKEDYLKQLDALSAEYAGFDAEDVARTREMIPNEDDVPGILAMLEAASLSSDVQLTAVNFAAGDSTGLDLPDVGALSISLSLEHGDYQRFKLFLEALQDNLRLFDVRSANVNPADANYTLTLRAYVWKKTSA